MEIGVIGLGAMGSRIARELLKAGHEVSVWNRSSESADQLAKQGAKKAASLADAMQGEITLSVLFDDKSIESTLLNGLPQVKGVHVCMSTLSAPFAERLRDFHIEHRIAYVGAPLLGRPEAVEKRMLNIFVGGANIATVDDLLSNLGKVWRLSDDPVHAQLCKLATNFMISGALEAMAEAAAMLRSHGADAEKFLAVMADTAFSSPIYKSYGPMIAGHPPAMPSGLALPIKDNASFIEAARNINAPLAKIIRENFLRAPSDKDDWSTALAKVASNNTER
jgi:3-hydroxyisobutyrate dehydrogenase-like beta-hydroxyacid dehydrogenase